MEKMILIPLTEYEELIKIKEEGQYIDPDEYNEIMEELDAEHEEARNYKEKYENLKQKVETIIKKEI